MKNNSWFIFSLLCIAISGCQRSEPPTPATIQKVKSPAPRPELVISREERWNVENISFLPDSNTMVVGGFYGRDPGTLLFWDLNTGTLKRFLSRLGSPLAVSPDGRVLASGSNNVKFWDILSDHSQVTFRNQRKRHWTDVEQYCFSPKNDIAVSGGTTDGYSQDGIARTEVWDVRHKRLLKTLKPAGPPLAFSPDGNFLATWGGDWSIRNGGRGDGNSDEVHIWDVNSLPLKRTFLTHIVWFSDIEFSPSGKTLAICGSNNIELREARTGRLIRAWKTQKGTANQIVFSRDGKIIVTGGRGYQKFDKLGKPNPVGGKPGVLSWWNVENGKLIRQVEISPQGMDALVTSPDGRFIIGGSSRIHFWDVKTGKLHLTLSVFPLTGKTNSFPNWVAYTPQGFFTGSPGVSQYIDWRINGEFKPVKTYAADFRRPELVRKALTPLALQSAKSRPSSPNRLLTQSDLQGKSAWELDLMRNEIFARHGRRFRRRELQTHFDAQPWYKPRAGYGEHLLSVQEKRNADFVLQYQQRQ